MMFFGCAYYPWRGLDVVPVLKYAVLINPLVYVAEGLRGVLTPAVPHMSLAVVVTVLTGMLLRRSSNATIWRLGPKLSANGDRSGVKNSQVAILYHS